MKKILYILLIGLSVFSRIEAEFDFIAPVSSDTVFIYLNCSLKAGERLFIEKALPGEEYELLTPKGIKGRYDGSKLKDALGGDYYKIEESLNLDDPQLVLLKLRTDAFYGMVFSLLYREAAKILGRFYAAAGNETGKEYRYRVKILNRRDEVVHEKNKAVAIVENPPEAPKNFQAKVLENSVKITWEYPDWSAEEQNPAVQFFLYRKKNGAAAERIPGKVFMKMDGMGFVYHDSDIYPGDRIAYSVSAVDAAGMEGPLAEIPPLTMKDLVPPPAPSGLSVNKSEKGIELNWNMSLAVDAESYDVYRWQGISDDSVILNQAPIDVLTPHFMDTTFQINRQYYYAVSALDSSGNRGRACNRISIHPTDRTPPPPPENPRAIFTEKGVRIEWGASKDEFLKGYYVTRGYDEYQSLYKITDSLIQGTEYIDSRVSPYELKPGQSYYYAVVAVDSFLFQSRPAGVWLTIPDETPPRKPGMVSCRYEQGGGVRIKWNPSPSLDVFEYKTVRIKNGMETVLGKTSFQSPFVFVDREVKALDTLVYQVFAVDTAGNESPAVFSDTLVIRDQACPPPVKFAEARVENEGVYIQWEKVISFDLAGYRVYRSNSPTGKKVQANRGILRERKFVDPQGTEDNWYFIVGVDSSNNESPPSKAVSPYKKRKKE